MLFRFPLKKRSTSLRNGLCKDHLSWLILNYESLDFFRCGCYFGELTNKIKAWKGNTIIYNILIIQNIMSELFCSYCNSNNRKESLTILEIGITVSHRCGLPIWTSPKRRALMMLAEVEGAERTATLGWKTTSSIHSIHALYHCHCTPTSSTYNSTYNR